MTGPRYRRIAGIDFSGAALAGQHCWFAGGELDGGRLQIDQLVRIDTLPGSARKRDVALSALRAFLAGQADLIVGCDFPFSLPKALLCGRDWRSWLLDVMSAYPTAEAFRDGCRSMTSGREWRRATDKEAGTPFSPYNLRLFRQTYWGTTGLLAPLVRDDSACVLPMMPHRAGIPALIETCPASVLKRWYGPQGNVGYKQSTDAAKRRRRAIVDRLAIDGIDLTASARKAAIETVSGDPLDAVLAAHATWRASARPTQLQPRPDSDDAVEARVYF